jgi:hypothetical protein
MAVGSMSVPEGQHATDHAQQICAQIGGNSNECSHMRRNIDCSPLIGVVGDQWYQHQMTG